MGESEEFGFAEEGAREGDGAGLAAGALWPLAVRNDHSRMSGEVGENKIVAAYISIDSRHDFRHLLHYERADSTGPEVLYGGDELPFAESRSPFPDPVADAGAGQVVKGGSGFGIEDQGQRPDWILLRQLDGDHCDAQLLQNLHCPLFRRTTVRTFEIADFERPDLVLWRPDERAVNRGNVIGIAAMNRSKDEGAVFQRAGNRAD